ncbi:hypothetical protein D3C79_964440 [compost metagenome]
MFKHIHGKKTASLQALQLTQLMQQGFRLRLPALPLERGQAQRLLLQHAPVMEVDEPGGNGSQQHNGCTASLKPSNTQAMAALAPRQQV